MAQMLLFVEPHDTLFFGDPRPFAAGETHSTSSLEFINPQTFYGMLRGQLYRNGIDLNNDAMKKLHITFLTWAQCTLQSNNTILYTPLFLSPINLAYTQNKEKEKDFFSCYQGKPFPLPIQSDQGDQENRPFWGWIQTEKPDTALKTEELSCLLKPNMLKYWLTGSGQNFRKKLKDILPSLIWNQKNGSTIAYTKKSIIHHEKRTGLALDTKAKRTQEGFLYTLSMLRTSDGIGFLIRVDCDDRQILDKLPGPAHLGGWRKHVTLHRVEKDSCPHVKEHFPEFNIPKKCHHIIIYFYTLSLFKNGYIPEWIDPITHKISWPSDAQHLPDCCLSSCYSYKHIAISGWDIENKCPKPVQRAVPPGAVWYINKNTNNDDKDFSQEETEKILSYLRSKVSLSDLPATKKETSPVVPSQMGFGLFLVGINR